jgi:hypothetical protein
MRRILLSLTQSGRMKEDILGSPVYPAVKAKGDKSRLESEVRPKAL